MPYRSNSVLLKPLESDSTAVGIPAKPVRLNGQVVEKKYKLAQVNADISKACRDHRYNE